MSKDKKDKDKKEKREKDDKKLRKSLERIEATLEFLSDEVRGVRERVDAIDAGPGTKDMTRDEVIAFLDRHRAAEALGEVALGAWIAVCQTPCLRGGLRVVQMREGAHARLFEQRIKELGGSPEAEADEAAEALFMSFGAADRSDAEKVDAFVKAAGDPEVLERLEAVASQMGEDEETQFLVRAVIEDERASLDLLHQAHALLCGRA